MGFYVDYGNGKRVMTPLAEIYQGYLDATMNDIAFGTFDYNTVLRRVVTQLTNSGLRYVDYASGWHNRVDVAARRAVMTGVSRLTGKISDMNAEKLGTEHFEVAWHGGARPEHARWQGKVWSKKELVTVCGLGTGPGLLGWNCYHEYYPFIKGISERNWSDEWLKEQDRKENTPKTFNGKEYTLYEAKQQQRKMETAMRAQREKVVLLKDGGADPDEVMLARAKYQGQLDEYGRFCKKMGLVQERERIYYDMRGRIAPYREKSDKNNIKRKEKRAISGSTHKAIEIYHINDTINIKKDSKLNSHVNYKTGLMPPDEYARAKNLWRKNQELNLPCKEKEHVYEELDNNLTIEEKEQCIVRRAIGNYYYTAINKGHNQYKIILKEPILETTGDVYIDSVLDEVLDFDWRKLL